MSWWTSTEQIWQENRQVDRKALTVRGAWRSTAAIVVGLLIGLLSRHPLVGMVLAGGAMSVGFGSFQELGGSRIAPMLWTSAGMGLAALIGTVARSVTLGDDVSAVAIIAGVTAGFVGLLSAVGPGALWIGQQCLVAMVIASAYPASTESALLRAGLITAGGLMQTIFIVLLNRFDSFAFRFVPPAQALHFSDVQRLLKQEWRWDSAILHYALRMLLVVTLAISLYHHWKLSSGYWMAMTAIFVLKPDFHQTVVRAWARATGTLIGAGLATLIAATLRPGPETLAFLVCFFAWFSYALLKVNYTLFSVCITSYIVFLLAFAGLPEKTVVMSRFLNTALGAALALGVYIHLPGAAHGRQSE